MYSLGRPGDKGDSFPIGKFRSEVLGLQTKGGPRITLNPLCGHRFSWLLCEHEPRMISLHDNLTHTQKMVKTLSVALCWSRHWKSEHF